jgi:hypothetical protein
MNNTITHQTLIKNLEKKGIIYMKELHKEIKRLKKTNQTRMRVFI